MPKEFHPELKVSGGRNGDGVTSIRSRPDSYIRGSEDHVFETDSEGKVIRDLTPQRVKLREQHRGPDGKLYEKMEKTGLPLTPADLEILQRMGVSK